MLKKFKKVVLLTALLNSIAVSAFAEDAPVYDADNYPPQFDEPAESAQGPANSGVQSYGLSNQPAPAVSRPLSMDQRLARIEQQINNMQRTDSVGRLNSLQTEVQALRGQVEQLNHQLQQLQNQQRTQYADLDKRISNKQSAQPVTKTQPSVVPDDTIQDTEVKPVAATKPKPATKPKLQPDIPADTVETSTTTTTATTETVATEKQPDGAEEQQTYQVAYDLIKAKKYNEAIAALQKMLQKYPSGQFAANAHYWLGELYGLLGKNDQAATEFNAVVSSFPNSPKVSDAQLKVGMIYAAQFKWPEAKASFKKVISRYPGSASARLAADQMKQIKAAGH